MPHPMFTAHTRRLDTLRAERMLDAAQAAVAQFQEAGWWDRLMARARGVAAEAIKRAEPLFTWNKLPVDSSAGLRQKFAQHVTGGRVES